MISSSFKPPLSFLVTAAGSGTRMGSGLKKEFRKIGNRSVLETTVLSMIESSIFSYGLITCPAGKIKETKELLSPLTGKLNDKNIKLAYCHGGEDRQQSVFKGLEFIADNFPKMNDGGIVLIHDGARPWVSPELVRAVAQGCILHGGCAPVSPSIDAMKQISDEGIITAHLPRRQTVSVQTPQGFIFNDILSAHKKAADDGCSYIDDTEIYNRYIGAVYTVEGEPTNKKITYAQDLSPEGEK